ncbi:oligoribonuclease [Actinomyces sp. zg-332]|uniref:oligoribonuclease n=1 Tax=Actinomyces sp. zg-332 TaxID=2708340 RepID=UPI0014222C44|nr:oligoribonuclease [Actinomyces sp. zg-332]QPK93657.1 oligoribonuclease [Actinomyces sp. zg-332]
MNTVTTKNPLVWIDCEMTGLDTNIDELVEVAVIVTDGDLNIIDEGFNIVIKPSQLAFNNMNDFVTNMHTTSGLIDELPNGVDIKVAQEMVLDYIKRFVPDAKKALLAGNSIATDKMFLEKQMPDVVEHLHYRIVDVSTIKELSKRWFPRVFYNKPDKNGGHRALADIRESIIELCYYKEVLFPEGEGPSTAKCLEVKAKFSPKTDSETLK